MTDEIDRLKRTYRNIRAPSHLATRIRAEVADRPLHRRSWMPAAATVMAIVMVAWLAPFVGEQPAKSSAVPSTPSLSAIMALKPDMPAGMSMSLSQLKTVKTPKLPTKPRPKATKSQKNLESESDLLEEKYYVHS